MRRWITIVLAAVVGILLIAVGMGYLWFQQTLKKSLPQTSGEILLSGLKQSVEIIRDTYGVPHIYASNEPDLYFALGFALAQDRMWQMEFFRRLGNGQVSELFGPDFLKVDRYFRMLTAAGVNREIPNELAFITSSFADGVNAYLETHRDNLPLEFKLLGYKPKPWVVDDYLAVLKVMNWNLSAGWRVDMAAARILEKVGEQRWQEAFPAWSEDGPLIVPEESKNLSLRSNPIQEVRLLVERLTSISSSGASNNWVVSAAKSISGKPILANDTHLGLSNPCIWWEVHLVCPTIDVSGFVLPGAPGVPIGHDRRAAWGVTNVSVDDVDFYIEKINPNNPNQYQYKGRWEDMKRIEETIRVKGQEPVKTEILLTRHGPVVSEASGDPTEKVLSARWTFTDSYQPAEAAYLLSKTRTVREVQEALKHWEIPSQNFVFADTSGNIGYWCCATIPIRQKGNGVLPAPGWTDEYEWQGYVPFDQRPHLINPGEGFIATANNKVVGDHYPYLIGHYWEPMDRISRIRHVLTEKGKFSMEDFKRIQQDVYCTFASEMTPAMIRVLERRFSDETARQAKDILAKWDFTMGQDSVGACLFEVTYRKMMENIFKDEMGEAIFQEYLQTIFFPPRALRGMIRKGVSPWFDDINTADQEAMEDILAGSLGQMLAELRGAMGNHMAQWTWGKIHSLTFEHVLGKKRPLDRVFNLGPFPVGGSHLTVNKKQYPYEEPYHAKSGVAQRMIVDLSDVGRSLRVLPTGESGNLASPHHNDQIDLYLNGGYHTAWMDRGEVEKQATATLILRPSRNQ